MKPEVSNNLEKASAGKRSSEVETPWREEQPVRSLSATITLELPRTGLIQCHASEIEWNPAGVLDLHVDALNSATGIRYCARLHRNRYDVLSKQWMNTSESLCPTYCSQMLLYTFPLPQRQLDPTPWISNLLQIIRHLMERLKIYSGGASEA